jgi:hypothetical protein
MSARGSRPPKVVASVIDLDIKEPLSKTDG